jgi:hypothetical protein
MNSAKPVNSRNLRAPTEVKIPDIFTKTVPPPVRQPAKTAQTWTPPSPSIESPLKPMPPRRGIEVSATKPPYAAATWTPPKQLQAEAPVKVDDRFTTAGFSDEVIQQNMIELPPPADLSDIRKMKNETLDELIASEGKSQNQQVIDQQREFAIMLFKKHFIIGTENKTEEGIYNRKFCKIAEVEFYPGNDPYRANDDAFNQSGGFYLRSNPNHHDKLTPQQSVLYLTIGHGGGILIRSIITPSGFVEGPEKVVEYIIKNNQVNQLALALNDPVVSAEGASTNQHVENSKTNLQFDDSKIVYNGPRVGLNLCQETALYGHYCMFVMKPYRYTFCPGELKLAKHTLAVTARLNGVPDTIINQDFKLPLELLGRWLQLFGRGESCYLEMFMDGKAKKLLDNAQQLMAYGFLSRFNK